MIEYEIIIIIIIWILSIYFGLSSLYLFIFSFSSLFYQKKQYFESIDFQNFLILIPAYKEDNVIINTAKEALKQNYPSKFYDVYVIADSFKKPTIEELKRNKVNVLEVSFEKSTKAKAINKALSSIKNTYDAIIILDADNIMEKDFIKKINFSLSNGHKAIQAHRVAKNQNNSISVLDSISEEINNSIFRKGHSALSLSSALIGSGMAFEYHLYKNIMQSINSPADEDKELELKLFEGKNKVTYMEEAYVFDEKISSAKTFVNQRSRWIASQLYYAKRYFFKAFVKLFTQLNIELFDKLIQLIILPRIIMLGGLFAGSVLTFFFASSTLFYFWIASTIICYSAILLAIPKHFINKSTLKALLYLPYGFFLMLFSIFRFKKSRKQFNPTPHTSNNTMKND
ncbi:MAG: glycosyltransferase [Bacteroidales bacterium]|nr:glycosyltransferase [Bacteroidales bacterium]